jgi:polysaccharide biosynthesis protein PslF
MTAMDPLSVCYIGTYPPTRCGLATFTRSLIEGITANDERIRTGVVRVVEGPEPPRLPDVVAEWSFDQPGSRGGAIEALRGFDVAIMQHEYGIYPGRDGADVVGLLRRSPIPVITVLHTVLTRPSPSQRKVLERVIELSELVVVPTNAARSRLLAAHEVTPERVAVISHGAVPNLGPSPFSRPEPTILTWGLIGPGKGLEYGIESMRYLEDLEPQPVYVIAGETHPKVAARDGERYREGLVKQAADLGVVDRVIFEDRYLDGPSLRALVRAADVILLPYESREQICSGVLVEAVAAGKPVVATAFPHAVELLSSACGIVVPHDEPEAIALAMRRLFTDRSLAASMRGQAQVESERLSWRSVGGEYLRLIERVLEEREAA